MYLSLGSSADIPTWQAYLAAQKAGASAAELRRLKNAHEAALRNKNANRQAATAQAYREKVHGAVPQTYQRWAISPSSTRDPGYVGRKGNTRLTGRNWTSLKTQIDAQVPPPAEQAPDLTLDPLDFNLDPLDQIPASFATSTVDTSGGILKPILIGGLAVVGVIGIMAAT